MMYVQVKKLPKDCICVSYYPFSFKFSRDKLYVYEPGVNCFGESIWFRSIHSVLSPLGKKLSENF